MLFNDAIMYVYVSVMYFSFKWITKKKIRKKRVIYLGHFKCRNSFTDEENIEEGNGKFSFLLFFVL